MSFILLGILNAQAEAGVAGSYDLLETQVLSSSASSVTFTGLGSYTDYKHLQLRMVVRSDRSADQDFIFMRLNSNSSNDYANHRLFGNGSSVLSAGATSESGMYVGTCAGSPQATGLFSTKIIDLLDYADTSKNQTARTLSGSPYSVGSNNQPISLNSSLWLNTDAVTAIGFVTTTSSNFVTGSRFSLYGIRDA